MKDVSWEPPTLLLVETFLYKDGNNKLNYRQYIPVFTSRLPTHLSSNIIKDILQIIEKTQPGCVVNYPIWGRTQPTSQVLEGSCCPVLPGGLGPHWAATDSANHKRWQIREGFYTDQRGGENKRNIWFWNEQMFYLKPNSDISDNVMCYVLLIKMRGKLNLIAGKVGTIEAVSGIYHCCIWLVWCISCKSLEDTIATDTDCCFSSRCHLSGRARYSLTSPALFGH